MRRALIIVILFGIMYGLTFFDVVTNEAGVQAKSLAAFGFVLLTAFTIGEIAKAVKLPAIIGFLVTGIVCGYSLPDVVNEQALFLTKGIVEELRFIDNLAIGLIALTAGGELQLPMLRKNAKAIASIIGLQVLIVWPVITGIVLIAAPYLVPWADLGINDVPTTMILGLGFMLAALAVGNSPAVAVAIVSETGSKGPFTDLNLGVTIAKDLVVVLLFSIFTAVAVPMIAGPASTGDTSALAVAQHLGYELGFSIIIGLAIGVIIAVYLNKVNQEVNLFLVIIIFGGMAIADILHLEKILVFIAAGFVVENYSDHGHDMIHAVEEVSLPVFVVFFALAGTKLDLQAISNMLWIALLVVIMRYATMWLSTLLGARAVNLPGLFQRMLGVGFFSQAGVTLGLAFIATNKLDKLQMPFGEGIIGSQVFLAIVMAIIAINLIVGPVCLKISLAASGETADQRARASDTVDETSDTHDDDNTPKDTDHDLNDDATRFPSPSFSDRYLNDELLRIRSNLERESDTFFDNIVSVQQVDFENVTRQILTLCDNTFDKAAQRLQHTRDQRIQSQAIRSARETLANQLLDILSALGTDTDASNERGAFQELIVGIERVLVGLNNHVVRVDPERFAQHPAPTFFAKLRKRFRAAPRERIVQIPRLTRFYVTGPLPQNLVMIANLTGFQRYHAWREISLATKHIDRRLVELLQRLGNPEFTPPNAPELEPLQADQTAQHFDTIRAEIHNDLKQVVDDLRLYAQDLNHQLKSILSISYQRLLDACEITGTFLLPDWRTNPSRVYDQNDRGRKEIDRDLALWRVATLGYAGILMTYFDMISLHHRTYGLITDVKIVITNALINDLRPEPQRVLEHVEHTHALLKESLQVDADLDLVRDQIQTQRQELITHISKQALSQLEMHRDRRDYLDLLDDFFAGLEDACLSVQSSYQILEADRIDFHEGQPPGDVELQALPLRELARKRLLGEIAVQLTGVNSLIQNAVDKTIANLSEVLRIVTFNLDAALGELNAVPDGREHEAIELAREFALGGLHRSQERLREMLDMVDQVDRQVSQMIEHETLDQLQHLQAMATAPRLEPIRRYLSQRSVEAPVHGIRGRVKHLGQQLNAYYAERLRPVSQHLVADFRDRLGLVEGAEHDLIFWTDDASFNAVRGDHIPITYRRLFSSTPVEIEEFFIGREHETQQLQHAFDRFQRDLASSVLIEGESGAGKTSFVEHAVRVLNPGLTVLRLRVAHTIRNEAQLASAVGELLGEHTPNLDRLRARLRNTRARRIVIIEGLHNFYLRTLDGFEGLQKFLLLVSETSHVLFWVVTIDSDALRFLKPILPPADHFTQHISLERFDIARIRAIIQARHNVSGYDLHFIGSREELLSPSTHTSSPRLLKGRQRSREEQHAQQFFYDLARYSAGNIHLAIFYWLRSIKRLHNNTIEITPLHPLDTHFIADMPIERLLHLGLLITHGGLNLNEFALVARISEDRARAILTGLAQANLLNVERGQVDIYHINPILFGPIADHLRAQRLI